MERGQIIKKLPEINLTKLRGWNKVKPEDQAFVQSQTDELMKSFAIVGNGWLMVGRHVYEIHRRLAPYRLFEKFLRLEVFKVFGVSRSKALRLEAIYEACIQKRMPPPVLQRALSTPKLLDVERVRKTPLPTTNDPEVIEEYLTTVSKPPKGKGRVLISDEKIRKGEHIYFERSLLRRIPAHRRAVVAREMAGYTLTLGGHTEPVTIQPLTIPEEFQLKKRGPKGPHRRDRD